MEQFCKVLKIRNLPIDYDLQAKKIIDMAIEEYEIIPFVPIIQKLRYHRSSPKNFLRKKSQEPDFINFWIENMKQLSKEYYFGKTRKWYQRISRRGRLLSKYTEPIFQGDLTMVALDMKAEMIAKILIKNYENEPRHFILFDILASRPLTFSEYVSLFIKYPETSRFIDAALGFSYERLFNKIFEKNTGVSIPLTIAPYLADVYPTQNLLSRL